MRLSLSAMAEDGLEALAQRFGFVRGEEGNRSAFVEAIALEILKVSHPWDQASIAALIQAFRLLGDLGHSEYMQELGRFMLSTGQLPPIFRSEVEAVIERQAWGAIVRQHIADQRPFILQYADAAGKPFAFTVRYAEFSFHEKRFYLDTWIEETEGNYDLPELQHNRCLRVDRIADAGVAPVDGEWRSGLDTVEAKIRLTGGMITGYQLKPGDLVTDIEQPTREPMRVITRQITNAFWLMREVLPRGAECVIIEPEALRLKQLKHYEDAIAAIR